MPGHLDQKRDQRLGLRDGRVADDGRCAVQSACGSSSSPHGSNHLNTTLLVKFDEHGGTYDHVPPGPAPTPGAPAGQLGFRFDRLGVRVPTIAVSAWIPERTVVTREHWNTSVLATLRERWKLGPPLTERDAAAATFTDVFALDATHGLFRKLFPGVHA
ncbi:alkaline phosphatase family protein [Streptomyces sp. NPDC090046]|uniref:alkaline phosphatase family protein n=1 Tax=Streptomyces sp. NPDC090046 TaxID=3365928 RepID=UPI00382B3F8D